MRVVVVASFRYVSRSTLLFALLALSLVAPLGQAQAPLQVLDLVDQPVLQDSAPAAIDPAPFPSADATWPAAGIPASSLTDPTDPAPTDPADPSLGPAPGVEEAGASTPDPGDIFRITIAGRTLPSTGAEDLFRASAAPAGDRLSVPGMKAALDPPSPPKQPPAAPEPVVHAPEEPSVAHQDGQQAQQVQGTPDLSTPPAQAQTSPEADPAPRPTAALPPAPQPQQERREITLIVVATVVSGGLSAFLLVRFLLPALGLLTRSRGEEGVHHVRVRILQIVEQDPGVLLTSLRRSIGCSAGTIQYHLGVLERAGTVRCVRERRRCTVFPAAMQQQHRQALAVLQRGRARDLARSVLEEPGVQQNVLTRRLGITRKTARRYLDGLVAQGLLSEQTHGRRRVYAPGPALGAFLATP